MPGRLVNGNHYSPDITDGSSTEDDEGAVVPLSPCVMSVIVQPPTDVRPGERFVSPLVISLESRPSGNYSHDIPENDNKYWALATLVNVGPFGGLGVLPGNNCATIRRATTPPQHPNLGYLVFDNLHLIQTGTFKIHVSLILMPEFRSLPEHIEDVEGAYVMDEIDTNEIWVDEDVGMRPRRKSLIMLFVICRC